MSVVPVSFGTVETAIKAALAAAMPYCRTVGTYAGELESIVAGLPVQFPFCGVFFSTQEDSPVDGPVIAAAPEFSVMLATQSFRGQEELRTGAVGAYRMIADARAALACKKLGLEIDRIMPAGIELQIASATAVGYRLRFRTSFDETFEED